MLQVNKGSSKVSTRDSNWSAQIQELI